MDIPLNHHKMFIFSDGNCHETTMNFIPWRQVIDTAHLHGALGGFKRLALTKFAEDAKVRAVGGRLGARGGGKCREKVGKSWKMEGKPREKRGKRLETLGKCEENVEKKMGKGKGWGKKWENWRMLGAPGGKSWKNMRNM
jgi:hypothetical protein